MERQYLVTERAHLMCPNMYFGILCTIKKNYDGDKTKSVLEKLTKAHPFLKCVIEKDERGYYYAPRQTLKVVCSEKNTLCSFEEDYQKLSENGWNVMQEGMLKIFVYPGENDFKILFVAHHLLCDGRGLLGLAISFSDCYAKGIEPAYSKECLIKSLADLPVGSDLPWMSKMVVNSANRNWKKEKQRVDYDAYLAFEKKYASENRWNMSFTTKSKEELADLEQLCHANEISVNDYLIAELMVKEKVKRVVIAGDIRKRLCCYKEGSLGNFSTAFSVGCNAKTENVVQLAKAVSKKVHQIMQTPQKLMLVLACYLRMEPELIDAVAIATLGDFDSKANSLKLAGEIVKKFEERNTTVTCKELKGRE